MKKSVCLLLLILIICLFTGCQNLDEKSYLAYNEAIFYERIDDNYYYKDFWFPLSNDTFDDVGYYTTDAKSINKGHKKNIKVFKDPDLEMFVLSSDFWGEFLYKNTNYDLPTYKDSNLIEKIIICDNNDKTWKENYDNNQFISITSQEQIKEIVDVITSVQNGEYKTDKLNYSISGKEIGIKFKNINAIYYLGMECTVDDRCYFYDPTGESVSYLIPNVFE